MKRLLFAAFFISFNLFAIDLKVGDSAPQFNLLTQVGKTFDLNSRKGTWTVLYFYPKAETPGCTKQACAFRDNIKKIRILNAEVFGISTDIVANQLAFHKNHNLNFDLLADDKSEVVNKYGSKMPVLNMSKRWTFIIDPDLKIKSIDHDVDPVLDADKVAKAIEGFQKNNNVK
jgi:peroxiredoxin Q/BCP